MKINFISDVHLEFGELKGLPGGDVLILAGDILVAKDLYWNLSPGDQHAHQRNIRVSEYNRFADEEFRKYQHVIAIAGNHEYYNGIIQKCEETLAKFYSDHGARYLQAQFVDIEDIRFVGATLWTNFNNRDWHDMQAAKMGMNDFYCIKHLVDSGKNQVVRFIPEDAANIFDSHWAAIQALLGGDKRNVVITHHLPTRQSLAYSNALDPAFATELGYKMMDLNIHTWIHGHVHHNVDINVGGVRVRCNPRGYVGHALNENFNIDGTILG